MVVSDRPHTNSKHKNRLQDFAAMNVHILAISEKFLHLKIEIEFRMNLHKGCHSGFASLIYTICILLLLLPTELIQKLTFITKMCH